jgi:hypothetical protein
MWHSPAEIHCLGGFVLAAYHGLARPTADIAISQVRGASDAADVQRIGGHTQTSPEATDGVGAVVELERVP